MAERRSLSAFLTQPPPGWTRVIVLQGLGLAGNLAATWIAVTSGNPTWLAVWVLSTIALIVGIYLSWRRVEPKVLVPEDKIPPKHRGLILFVGTGRPGEDPMTQSAWKAIEHHLSNTPEDGLETCWLIASKESLPTAQKYQEMCKARHVTAHVRSVENAFIVQSTYDVVQHVYTSELAAAKLPEQDVIADFTGGTKPMSAGMILACGDRRSMQYMEGRAEGVASVPRLVEFTPRRSLE